MAKAHSLSLPSALLLLIAVFTLQCFAAPDANQAVILAQTNAFRRKHKVGDLAWDDALAAEAQAYANKCPGGHDPNNRDHGENLWAGYGQTIEASMAQVAKDYYSEIKDYNFADPGAGERSGKMTGHLTQLLWKGTQRLGCAARFDCPSALGLNGGGQNVIFSVCRYDPPGNVQMGGSQQYDLYKQNVFAEGANNGNNGNGNNGDKGNGDKGNSGNAGGNSGGPTANRRVRVPTPPKASPKPSPKPAPKPAVTKPKPKPATPKPVAKPSPKPSPKRSPPKAKCWKKQGKLCCIKKGKVCCKPLHKAQHNASNNASGNDVQSPGNFNFLMYWKLRRSGDDGWEWVYDPPKKN